MEAAMKHRVRKIAAASGLSLALIVGTRHVVRPRRVAGAREWQRNWRRRDNRPALSGPSTKVTAT